MSLEKRRGRVKFRSIFNCDTTNVLGVSVAKGLRKKASPVNYVKREDIPYGGYGYDFILEQCEIIRNRNPYAFGTTPLKGRGCLTPTPAIYVGVGADSSSYVHSGYLPISRNDLFACPEVEEEIIFLVANKTSAKSSISNVDSAPESFSLKAEVMFNANSYQGEIRKSTTLTSDKVVIKRNFEKDTLTQEGNLIFFSSK